MNHHRHRPRGEAATRLGETVGAPVRGEDRLGDGASGVLELERHAVGEPQHRHVRALVHVDMLHRGVERCQGVLLELRGGLAAGELRLVEDLVGRISAHSRERRRQELPQAAGVALAGDLRERLERHFLRAGSTAVGQRRLDHERVAPVDARRPGGCGEKLSWHDLPQSRQQARLADRHDAVGGRRRDLRLLDRLVEGIGLAAAELRAAGPRRKLRRVAELSGDPGGDAREGAGEELGQRQLGVFLEHRHEATELDAIGMRFDLLRLRWQFVRRSLEDPLRAVGPLEMDAAMGIGDRRLLEILLDAAAATLELRLHLDRHARAVIDRVAEVVDGHPLDVMLGHQVGCRLAGRKIDSFPLAVEDLRLVGFRVDPQLVVVGRLLEGGLRDDLHRLAGREHAVHPGGRDPDPLLAAAHPQAVELRAVEELAEDQRDLLAHDPRAVVLHPHAEARGGVAHRLNVDPDLGKDARFLAGIERVVDRFLDAREERLAGRIEPEQMAVLREELAHRDVALAGGKGLGRGAALRRRGRGRVERCRWLRSGMILQGRRGLDSGFLHRRDGSGCGGSGGELLGHGLVKTWESVGETGSKALLSRREEGDRRLGRWAEYSGFAGGSSPATATLRGPGTLPAGKRRHRCCATTDASIRHQPKPPVGR